jgi:hypothetical protein
VEEGAEAVAVLLGGICSSRRVEIGGSLISLRSFKDMESPGARKSKADLTEEALDRLLHSKSAGSIQTEADVVSLALFPGLGRDATDNAQTNTAILAPGTRRLRLELGTDHPGFARYRAEALTAEGGLVWSRDALRERPTRIGKAVVITLPVALLTRNAYLITLSGAAAGGNYERINSYYFEIIRK